MAKNLGGTAQQYKEYVTKNQAKRFWEIFRSYCTENNVDWKGKNGRRDPEKWKQMKLRKLAIYFNKDEKDFE